jgi:hypothetical protein
MENRNSNRYETEQSIVATVFNSKSFNEMAYGKIIKYCALSMYAELQTCFKEGTILMIRATSSFNECLPAKIEEGFRSISLVEVKDSKPLNANGDVCYGTELKHLIIL